MQNWNRPDPLTRDLIHLINARRHDHWDADAAFDTLAELIEQNREDEILTVLAALDEVPRGVQATWKVSVEREGSDRPCCVAEWLARYYQ